MSERKYVFANLRVPIEVFENKSYNIMNDYLNVSVEKCEELPEKQSQNTNLMDQLFSICFNSQYESVNAGIDKIEQELSVENRVEDQEPKEPKELNIENNILVKKNDKIIKKRENATFRKRPFICNRYTRRKYSNNI